ncbi:MAG: response regulator receiver protein [Thermoleophilia bacterium]|nr:response regulator receiver protein [Thermoleophilia bacterium]
MPIRLGICDDKESFRRMLAMCLAVEPDIEVIGEAADGAEAIQLAERESPDVMLLDVAMPVMDGIEALPQLRLASPGTVVVMLSGFASRTIADEALAAGAWRFIEKGTSLPEILDAVRAAFAERSVV